MVVGLADAAPSEDFGETEDVCEIVGCCRAGGGAGHVGSIGKYEDFSRVESLFYYRVFQASGAWHHGSLVLIVVRHLEASPSSNSIATGVIVYATARYSGDLSIIRGYVPASVVLKLKIR